MHLWLQKQQQQNRQQHVLPCYFWGAAAVGATRTGHSSFSQQLVRMLLMKTNVSSEGNKPMCVFSTRVCEKKQNVPVWFLPHMFFHTCGRKSADRTKPHFDVIFFVFLSTYFGNLEVCCAKTFNIFWKYMSARLSTYLCFDQSFIGGLFNYPYILPFLKKLLHFKTLSAAYFRHFLFFLVIW